VFEFGGTEGPLIVDFDELFTAARVAGSIGGLREEGIDHLGGNDDSSRLRSTATSAARAGPCARSLNVGRSFDDGARPGCAR
jgi:hypothetical protein